MTFVISPKPSGILCPGILGGVGQGLGLVVSDVLHAQIGFLNGQVIDKAQVEKLASIPSKEQLIANLLAMLNAPVSALARAIQAIADKQN